MSDFRAIALAGASIARYLRTSFAATPPLTDPSISDGDPLEIREPLGHLRKAVRRPSAKLGNRDFETIDQRQREDT